MWFAEAWRIAEPQCQQRLTHPKAHLRLASLQAANSKAGNMSAVKSKLAACLAMPGVMCLRLLACPAPSGWWASLKYWIALVSMRLRLITQHLALHIVIC